LARQRVQSSSEANERVAQSPGFLIDTRRSLRLELIVVVLIAFEIVITFHQIYAARGH
jgi:uncharacterized Rmd1/YagE family protein